MSVFHRLQNRGHSLRELRRIAREQRDEVEARYPRIMRRVSGYNLDSFVDVDQVTSNLERAWEITGGTEDQLTGTMVRIGQVLGRGFRDQQREK